MRRHDLLVLLCLPFGVTSKTFEGNFMSGRQEWHRMSFISGFTIVRQDNEWRRMWMKARSRYWSSVTVKVLIRPYIRADSVALFGCFIRMEQPLHFAHSYSWVMMFVSTMLCRIMLSLHVLPFTFVAPFTSLLFLYFTPVLTPATSWGWRFVLTKSCRRNSSFLQ